MAENSDAAGGAPVPPAAEPHEDSYAWIADHADPAAVALLAAERAYYDERTTGLVDLRDRLAGEMVGRVPPHEPEAPWEQAGWTYRYDALEGADHPRLLRSRPGHEEVLLDLESLARETGSGYCETGVVEPSPDGRWLAWSVDVTGDEVYALHFRELDEGEDLGEVVRGTMASGAWAADSRRFFYPLPDDRWRSYQVWCHELGTDPSADVLVHQEDDERFELEVRGARSGEWIVLRSFSRDTSEERLVPAGDPSAAPRLVRARERGVEYALEHDPAGNRFLVVTNLGAPEFRLAVAAVDAPGDWADHPDRPVRDDERLLAAHALRDGAVLELRSAGAGIARVLPRTGAAYDVTSPTAGGLVRVGPSPDYDTGTVRLVVESLLDPPEHVDVTLADGHRRTRHRTEVLGVDRSAYLAERVLAEHDGVEVPVEVLRHRHTPLDGTAPCLLYGYGAYEATCESDFGFDWWRTLPSLLDRGVVFAMGHPRGGGELGRHWWLGGRLHEKPNTFDDQAAVADRLADGLVDPARIVTRGLSAGGLLQGALYARRPDRWAGVLAEVPFVDVVTTMLDASLPLTAGEWDEWGDPRDPADRAVMASYSPMENRPPVPARPPLLVTGAVHDTRVLVREPARWVARLRDDDPDRGAGVDPGSPVSRRTVLFRVETGAGAHAGPPGRYGQLKYEAEVLAWCLAAMGVES